MLGNLHGFIQVELTHVLSSEQSFTSIHSTVMQLWFESSFVRIGHLQVA